METPKANCEPHQPHIGSLNEKPLHAALKEWVARPGDRLEVPVDGYVVDIVRGDLLIEIQTSGFASIKAKSSDLIMRHRLRLVYPIAQEKWLVKLPPGSTGSHSRRKSPKRGSIEDVFRELVSLAALICHPNFSLEVLLIREEELRRYDPQRAWRRRGWVTQERRLLGVEDRRLLASAGDILALLPPDLPEPWSTSDLASALRKPRRLAQQMAYCLRVMGAIHPVGKQGNAILYTREAE